MSITTVAINDRSGTEKDVVVDDLLGGSPTELMQVVRAWRHKGAKHTTTADVTSTAASALAARTARISATFYNAGPNTAYLSENASVTDTSGAHPGLPLGVGAALVDDDSNDVWYAACSTAETATLVVVEVY